MAAAAPPSEEECPVCHDDFTDPKILPCLHLVCGQCLLSWLQAGGHQAGCPLCRAALQPRSAGQDLVSLVVDLPTDIITKAAVDSRRILNEKHVCLCDGSTKANSFCMQCGIKLCPACVKAHKVIPTTRDHQLEPISSLTVDKLASSYQSSCTAHPGRQVEQFCSSHQQLICISCSTSAHRACPDVEEVAAAARVRRQELKERVRQLELGKREIQEQILQLDAVAGDAQTKFKAMKDKVKTTFDELHRILDKRCGDATAEIQRKEDDYLSENKRQKEELEKQRARFVASGNTVSRLVAAPDDPLLAMLLRLQHHLQDAELLCRQASVAPPPLPARLGDFVFDQQSTASLKKLIAKHGEMRDPKKLLPKGKTHPGHASASAHNATSTSEEEEEEEDMREDDIPNLKPCQLKVLSIPSVLDRFYKRYPGLKVSVNKERKIARVTAPEDEMKKAFSQLLAFVTSLRETKLSLTPGLLKMFEEEDTKDWIQKTLIDEHGFVCHWEVADEHIILSGQSSELPRIQQMFEEAFKENKVRSQRASFFKSVALWVFMAELEASRSPPRPVLLPEGDGVIIVDTPGHIADTELRLRKLLAQQGR